MIKIYYANIQNLSLENMAQYLEKLHKQRQEKVARCKNEADKKRSLMAGLLLRHALEQEGMEYDVLEFIQNVHGKPMLKGYDNVHFSISHAKDYVICAIGDCPIGVDVEDVMRHSLQQGSARLTAIARKCFTDRENRFLDTAGNWQEAFLKVWTRKEAYGKAVGTGLNMELSQTDVLSDAMADSFWSGYWMETYYLSIYAQDARQVTLEWMEWKPQ